MIGPPQPVLTRSAVIGMLLGATVGLINLPKPIHIDDALYLAIARRIASYPLDPYGGVMNWQQVPEPTYRFSISPPLFSYYLAAVIVVAGESEIALHAAMIPWLCLAGWGLGRLGDRWNGMGAPTAAFVLGSPAVMVGCNLMLDVPLLACTVVSMELMLDVLDRQYAPGRLAAASCFAVAAVLIKYAALAVVPVFLLIAWLGRRSAAIVAAVSPLIAFLVWQWLSGWMYNRSQLAQGLGFLDQFSSGRAITFCERVFSLTAIFAMTFPTWLISAFAATNRSRKLLAATIFAGAAALLMGSAASQNTCVVITFIAATGCGVFSVLDATSLAWHARSTPSRTLALILGAWFVCFAAFAILFAPFVAVRSFLPIQPPMIIVVLSVVNAHRIAKRAMQVALACTVCLGGLLAWADARWAAFYPRSVAELDRILRSNRAPVHFLGHWGMQHYAHQAGWTAWDARWTSAAVGSVVVLPQRADRQFLANDMIARLEPMMAPLVLPAHPFGLTNWNRSLGIRFYGGDFGEIPWGFSSEPTESIATFRVGSP